MIPEYVIRAPRLPPEEGPAREPAPEQEFNLEPVVLAEPDPGPDAPAFVDTYLSVEDPHSYLLEEQARARQRAGRRRLEGELIHYSSDHGSIGDENELALLTRWRQETLNWGEFDAQLILSRAESNFLNRERRNNDVYFTLRQSNAPLDNGWLMNTAAGHQRTYVDPFLHSGYRIRLPASLFVGASMGVDVGGGVGQWYMGKTGDDRGIAVPLFVENGGEILGASWRQAIADDFLVGGEIVNVRDGVFVPDHTSLLVGGSYSAPDGAADYGARLLADDNGNFGLWADGVNVLWSDLVMRYGAFYLDPGLTWMDRAIANNQSGLYARADRRSHRYNYSVGFDYTRIGIGDGVLTRSDHQSIYGNFNYRITRRLSMGINGNLAFREVQSTLEDSQMLWRLSNFLSYRFLIGVGRLEAYASALASDVESNNDDIAGARFTYDWNMPQGYRLATEAQLEERQRRGTSRSDRQISVLFRQSVFDNISWGLDVSYQTNESELLGNASGVGISGDLRWQFLPDWYVSASLAHNQTSFDSISLDAVPTDSNLKSKSVWLRIGYASVTGQPFQRYGRNTNGAGAGRVTGVVFYDENRDFIRQPGERPAAGVTVMIDGRYETRTDAQGRYTFDPVYPGSHRISIITDDLPLPWGLDDESPQGVEVRRRQTDGVDFPLVDLSY